MGIRSSILAFALIFSCLANAENKSISLAYVNYPPFYGPELEDGGPFTDIINAAYQSQGYQVQFEFVPWARGYKATQKGEFDGLYTAWYREDREKDFLFSNALPANEVVFFKRKTDSIVFKEFADLKPYQIGVVRGYSQPPGFAEARLDVQEVKSDKQNLQKLAKGFIDLTPIDRAVGKYLLRTEMPQIADQIDWIEPPIEVANQYIIFSKAANNIGTKKEAFNEGLKLITENGQLKAILKKHNY